MINIFPVKVRQVLKMKGTHLLVHGAHSGPRHRAHNLHMKYAIFLVRLSHRGLCFIG